MTGVGGRTHVQHHQVGPAIVVEVVGIGAHGAHGGMAHFGGKFIAVSTVLLVHPQAVGQEEIVGHVNIQETVQVIVGDGHSQAETDLIDTGFAADVGPFIVVVPVEFVAIAGVGIRIHSIHEGMPVGFGVRPVADGMIQHKEVQITVVVHIEEDRLGTQVIPGDAIFLCHLLKSAIALVQVEQVGGRGGSEVGTAAADIDVQPAIAVHIRHGHARAPAA